MNVVREGTVPPAAGGDAAELPSAADVVVIGAGIVGCATAYYLARRGAHVVVCERRAVAAEQSGRNWGFVQQQGRGLAEVPLLAASNKIWRGLEQELGAKIDWVQRGNLIPAPDEARLAELREWLEIALRFGLDTRLVNAAEVARLIPTMAPRFVGGLYTPSDGHADAVKTTLAFCRGAIQRGASVLTDCPVESITTDADAISGVVTSGRSIRTSRVVCAAGAWSTRLLRPLGLRLTSRLVRATVARTNPLRPVTPVAVWAPALAFRQRSDGRFDLGAHGGDYDLTLEMLRHPRWVLRTYLEKRQRVGFHVGGPLLRDLVSLAPWSGARRRPFGHDPRAEPRANPSRAASSLKEFRALFPSLNGVVLERTWAGYMDATPDLRPVIGEVAKPRGLVLATGFSGHGFSLGPIVGRLVAELIIDGKPSLDLHAFRFSRFEGG